MSRDFDYIVIGASVGGLAAAGYLARSGARVLVVEEALAPPEPRGALFALDPAMIADLRLEQHGFSFRARDLALTGWDEEEPPLTLPRDRRAAVRAIAALSESDAQAWGSFQAALQAHASVLRRWWSIPRHEGRAADLFWRPSARSAFARLCVSGAADFLARYFETRQLIGTLLQDALLGGFAPSEPGSALALVWRASQAMAGQQGAVALPVPGTLTVALRRAARAELQTGMSVAEIMVARGQAVGVRLADGEVVSARAVLSSLSRNASERLAGLERPREASLLGEARIVFTLGEAAALPQMLLIGRCVAALPPEDCADAHEVARAGRLPSLPPFTVVAETPRALAVSLPLMPVTPKEGWAALKAPLAAQMLRTLQRQVPGLAQSLTGVTVTPPRTRQRASLAQLLVPAFERAVTRVPGLYLCGEDAEPVPCISGRAGRFAAHFVSKSR
jgi:phytoene dehydrogenase-like protein